MAGFRPENRAAGDRLVQRTLCPVKFDYSEFRPDEQQFTTLRAVDNQLPAAGLQHPEFALVDLFGDGLPDVLHAGDRAYRYWRNLGAGKLDMPRIMSKVPAGLSLASAGVSFGDTDGDGRVELLVQAPPLEGFFETSSDGGWESFRAFPAQPAIDRTDPNLRRIDLTGDGSADMLITRDHHFLWYQNPRRRRVPAAAGSRADPRRERVSRRLLQRSLRAYPACRHDRRRTRRHRAHSSRHRRVLAQSRIWPIRQPRHHGHACRCARARHAVRSVAAVSRRPRRVSGCADLVYVGPNEVFFWFNQNGNTWSARQVIRGTPVHSDRQRSGVCGHFRHRHRHPVWSRDLGTIPGGNYFALDFCGGVKPHLLIGMDNGLGAIARVTYAPSTRFALEDAAAGSPGTRRCRFPCTWWRRSRPSTSSAARAAHHKLPVPARIFRGREREFRGFGRVEQLDTEEFDDFARGSVDGNVALNADKAMHQPPVLTKTWFHTGAWIEAETLAAKFRSEFWGGDPQAFQLADHDVPDDPEAFRALRGAVLRSEVYALDADPFNPLASKAHRPYSVTENRHRVRQLQPRGSHQHGVFLVSMAESIVHHYERNPADPRIAHEISAPPDDLGNVTDKIAIAYPRRIADAEVPEQAETKIAFTKTDYINSLDAATAGCWASRRRCASSS